jgi:hypothetical protein
LKIIQPREFEQVFDRFTRGKAHRFIVDHRDGPLLGQFAGRIFDFPPINGGMPDG